MAKFSKYKKMSKEQKQKVLLELCQALVFVNKIQEAAKLLGDLLSDQEVEMVGKRLQIAKYLLNDKTYAEICKELDVSPPTVARVNLWIQEAGEGFRLVMSRGLGKRDMKIPEWQPPVVRSEMARRYPLYYWPQGLLETIVRTANNRQRKKLIETMQILRNSGKGKREVFRYLESLLDQRHFTRQRSKHTENEMQIKHTVQNGKILTT